ncbi:Cyclin-dependent kinase inhibitor [Quillaja saponaria]|uniref:Cyclin-dependent kinase inhibitor n=1 Tax=Quillaja saponaria TaxID=32244 RepID=A0AAD7KSK0_QUISA|nr:Cyclin-dependent kinase inhibitor [Quillaja saponaria]
MEVAQVGVRTRARATVTMEAETSAGTTAKRRKINNSELLKSSSSFYVVDVRSRKHLLVKPENKVFPVAAMEEPCSSSTSDQFQASCCSSNNSSELDEDRIKFVDLEVESAEVEISMYSCERSERREMSTPPASTELGTEIVDVPETTASPAESNSGSRSTVEKKAPTESELEEFFEILGTSEKETQKRLTEKYNFDFVNDVPLEGRYEWVRLKP